MNNSNETPSKSKPHLMNKVLTNQMNCDSPFRFLPHFSTPPSRFAKILNPFEPHLTDRLHLPTFSPSVFAQGSTPKTEDNFKWTINDISSLKPADIDENTLSQHVSDHDPTIESMAQEKIDKFFNEKFIAPSPLTEQVKQTPLVTSPFHVTKLQSVETACQTLLTLPPKLPKHVEEVLAPYFTYNQQEQVDQHNSSLYRKLFEFDNQDHNSLASSPALSTSLSPIQFSPEFCPKEILQSTIEMPELRECTLSPIGRPPSSKSACRLSFSGHMSVDASILVPDVNKSLNVTSLLVEPDCSFQPAEQLPPNQSIVDWDVEYNHVSILSRSPVSSPDIFDSSHSDTPHSKLFTSQRKRLSDSFKIELDLGVVEEGRGAISKRVKNIQIKENITDFDFDTGYHTGGTTMCDSAVHMFASTPTKIKH